jgi:hypothetical protein
MTARPLVQQGWREELDSFSRQHEGWIVSVTTRNPQGEVAVSAHDLPLQGVSLASPRSNDITIAVGHGRDQLTHQLQDATSVQIDRTATGADRALVIRGGDGTTMTIEFRSPMRPEEVDGIPHHG